MAEKLQQSEFEEIIKPLPPKDRIMLREEEITQDWLRNNIEYRRKLMKRDRWIGPIWVVIYGIALFKTGYGAITISIFVVGAVYFLYTLLTTGSYGLNRKRISVYEALLNKMLGKNL